MTRTEGSRRARSRHLVALAARHRGAIALVLVLTISAGLAAGLEPMLLGRALDAATARDGAGMAHDLALQLGLALGAEVVRAGAQTLAWRVRLSVSQGLVVSTVAHIQRLPISFHRQQRVGELMARFDRGTQGLVTAFSDLTFQVVPAAVYVITASAAMLALEPRLAMLVFAFAPLPFLVTVLASPEQVRRERELMTRWTRLYGRFHEVLQAMLTVKSFAMEEAEQERFLAGVTSLNGQVLRGIARDARTDALRNVIVVVARGAAMAAGAWLAFRAQASPGTVLAFAGYLGALFGPLQSLGSSFQIARRATVALETIGGLLDETPEGRAEVRDPGIATVHGGIELREVTFGYDPRSPVLRGMDLRVAPGECVALVGPSGCGKSTVIGLVQRLHDPQRGEVRVDGRDLRTIDPRWWRRRVGVVLQDGVLFDDTVAANIAYGRPDASRAEIEAVARVAWADTFIRALPDGYDSPVGERGSSLSAGQRQRIAIARALLTDPPILVLDEATSALDTESEYEVQRALRALIQGRTTLIIAHRLSTVVHADRIVALSDGRIVEDGTHGELVARGGYYASLVALAKVS